MPPKKPQAMFAVPWATHSRLPRPRVSVISSISVRVSSDSISPTAARMIATGKTIRSVSRLSGTAGMEKAGRPPASDASELPVIVRR